MQTASKWHFHSGSGLKAGGAIGLFLALSLCPLPAHPHPTVQTASWRNRCLWTVSASHTPETCARNASARKAMLAANPGSAPGPPVPTRCLVSVARTTAMVRRAGWGVVSVTPWPLGLGKAACPGGRKASPWPLAALSSRLCLWRERVPQWG